MYKITNKYDIDTKRNIFYLIDSKDELRLFSLQFVLIFSFAQMFRPQRGSLEFLRKLDIWDTPAHGCISNNHWTVHELYVLYFGLWINYAKM